MESDEQGPPKDTLEWAGSQPASSNAGWIDDLPDPGQPHPFEEPDAERYERRGLLGQGGMGRVVTVLDRRLRREVALKEVAPRPGSTHETEARLAREAWITAQLEHPGIVSVHDAGRTEDGRLYYTMRLIRGKSLETCLQEAPQLDDRLRLLRAFLDACQAVAYAHSLGVIHRDIKPANIMIGEFGETQVVDWGLARPTDSDRGARWREAVLPEADLSRAERRTVAGTPAYMSPEQASGEPADERSDVWSLGAVLHELLTGRPPFTGATSREILKQLRTRPPDPITDPSAPAELVAIAALSLSRDPEQRYANAREMAADVIRYVDGHHVRAYDYTPTDHLRRFLSAWRIPALITAVAVMLVIAVALIGAMQTAQERDRAQEAEARMAAALRQADESLTLAFLQQARTAAAVGARPEAEILAARSLVLEESPEARGVLAAFDNARPTLLSETPTAEMPCGEYAWQLTRDGALLVCLSHTTIAAWRLSPLEEVWSRPIRAQYAFLNEGRGEVMLTGQDIDHRAIFLGLSDGALLRELPARENPTRVTFARSGRFATIAHSYVFDVETAAIDPDRRLCEDGSPGSATIALADDRFAWVCADGDLRVGPIGAPEFTIPLATETVNIRELHRLSLSSDERWIVAHTHRGDLLLIDLAEQKVERSGLIGIGAIRDLAISPDSRLIAVAGEHGGIRIWHRPTGVWLSRLPTTQVHQLHFSDPTTLVVLGDTLQRWHIPASFGPDRALSPGGFNATAFSPDGTMLCGATGDGRVLVWAVSSGTVSDAPLFEKRMVERQVTKDCDFTADNKHLMATAIRHLGIPLIRTDDWTTEDTLHMAPGGFPYHRRLGALRGGLYYSAPYRRNGPEIWRAGSPETLDALRVPGRYFGDVESNHDRTAALFSDQNSQIYRLRDGDPPELRGVLTHSGLDSLDIANDGDRIAVGTVRTVELYSIETQALLTTFGPTNSGIKEVSFSADDRYLAAGQDGGFVHLWEVETGELVAVLQGHNELITSIAFSSDGTTMATASWDGALRLWGLSSLHTPAQALVERFDAAWQLSLEEALAVEVN